MSQRDLWDKAAACARAAEASDDPTRREVLTCLGEFSGQFSQCEPVPRPL